MTRFRFIIIICFLTLSLCGMRALAAYPGSEFSSKISIETHMEERLKTAITEITGTDKVIVVVNADIDTSRQRAVNPRKGTLTRKEDTNALVLPGVPAKKEIGKSPTQTAELNLPEAPLGAGTVMIRRLVVTILLDKGVPAALVNTVRDIAASVVDLNPNRGDKLDVKQMDIRKMNFRWSSFFYPPHLYWLILIITGAGFLLAASLFLMNPFIKLTGSGQSVKIDVAKDALAGKLTPGGEAVVASENVADSGASAEKESVGRPVLPFSFLKENHLRDISFLLSKESSLDLAIIINYLDMDLAIKLLDYFPEEKQAEIAVSLTAIEEVSPDRINRLEDRIKERLGYLIGGEDKVANLLGMVSDEVRDRVFDIMEIKDATIADRLRHKVKGFEDVMRDMPPHGIQVLYRQMDHAMFAQVLKSAPEDIQKKVISTLSAGAAELLQQEMDLSRPIPPARLKKEKLNMMVLIRRMIKEGTLEVENN